MTTPVSTQSHAAQLSAAQLSAAQLSAAQSYLGAADGPVAQLQGLLEETRRRHDLQALAVADDEGLLVAGAGSRALCEELSVLALQLEDTDRVWKLPIADAHLALCSTGPIVNAELATRVAQACERVLGGPY